MKTPYCELVRFRAYGPSGALSSHQMAVPFDVAELVERERNIAVEALREIARLPTLQTEPNNLAVMALREIAALRAGG